jgi:ubiquinone/menaquinone biosynthesis C-methylase UbiE
MALTRFLASQLRKPSGWFGTLLSSRLMNRGNRRIIDGTLALLELDPQHHVLEIGFGGGVSLALVAQRLSSGVVSGVDFSGDMVRQAERRFRRKIEQGRVRIQSGDISGLPFADAAFDRVFTINTIYFWPDTRQGMSEIHRVLKDDGMAAIGLRSKEKMGKHAVTKYGFRLFSPQEVADLMCQAGFRNVRVDHRDQDHWNDQVIVVGTR